MIWATVSASLRASYLSHIILDGQDLKCVFDGSAHDPMLVFLIEADCPFFSLTGLTSDRRQKIGVLAYLFFG